MTKQEIRKIFLERRKTLSACQRDDISEAIATNFFSFLSKKLLENTIINYLHIFLPITSKNEIDTFLIIRKIQKEYPEIKLLVPKVNLDIMQIESYLLEEDFEETPILKLNKWNILEIENGKKIENSEIDIVLLPLLAFDKDGFRVGYGKGFYDKFLEKCYQEGNKKIIKIGLSSENNATFIEDLNEFDQKMDFCVTPNNIIKF